MRQRGNGDKGGKAGTTERREIVRSWGCTSFGKPSSYMPLGIKHLHTSVATADCG